MYVSRIRINLSILACAGILLLFTIHALLLTSARSYFVAGWELIGVAQGRLWVEQIGFWPALGKSFIAARNFAYWNATNSVPFGFIPGYLNSLLPWLYWGNVIVAASFIISVAIWGRVSRAPLVFCCCILSSPVLLSHSLMGYPYISGVLPVGLGLALLFSHYPRSTSIKALLATTFLSLLIFELSLHCYETGKSVGVFLALGALLVTELSRRQRILLLSLGAAYTLGIAFIIKGANVSNFVLRFQSLPIDIEAALAHVPQIFLSSRYDLPVLSLLGLFCLPQIKSEKLFWRAFWVTQLCMLLWASLEGDGGLRSRRLILWYFSNAGIVALAWEDCRNTLFRGFIGITLTGGAYLGLQNSVAFFSAEKRELRLSLPYTASPADLSLNRPLIEDSEKLLKLLDASKEANVLWYGNSVYSENSTDPQALPERILLQIGSDEFKAKVFFVDRYPCRYSCVPSIDPKRFNALAEKLGHFLLHVPKEVDATNFQSQHLANSEWKLVDVGLSEFRSYQVERFSPVDVITIPVLRNPIKISTLITGYCLQKGSADNLQQSLENKSEIETVLSPLRYETEKNEQVRFWGILDSAAGKATLDAVIDDEVLVKINDQTVIDLPGNNDSVRVKAEILLPAGENLIKIAYGNGMAKGILSLDIMQDGHPVKVSCAEQSDLGN